MEVRLNGLIALAVKGCVIKACGDVRKNGTLMEASSFWCLKIIQRVGWRGSV